MSDFLAVVCPQCKQQLTVPEVQRSRPITCPDCRKVFKIGAIMDPVVASKQPTYQGAHRQSASAIPPRPDRWRNETIESGADYSHRSSRAKSNSHRRQVQNDMDDALNSTGFFLIMMAVFSAILPLFDLRLGQFSLPVPIVLAVSILVGAIGAGMMLVANKMNRVVVGGTLLGLGLVVMVVWVANTDIGTNSFALRNRTQDDIDAAHSVDTDAADPSQTKPRRLKLDAGFGTDTGIKTNADSKSKEQTKQQQPRRSHPAVEFRRSQRELRNLPEPIDDRPKKTWKDRQAEDLLDRQDDIKDEAGDIRMRSFQRPPSEDKKIKAIEIDRQFRKLHQVDITRGLPQDIEFLEQYNLSEVCGRTTNYGHALFDGNLVKGLDTQAAKKRLGFSHILPVTDFGRYDNSLIAADSEALSGVRINFENNLIAGIQAVFSEVDSANGRLSTTKSSSSNWNGRPSTKTVSLTGSKMIYGLVVYVDNEHVVGVQLIYRN